MPIDNSLFNRFSDKKRTTPEPTPQSQARRTVCVIRETQYVPASQVLNFEPGETLYTGVFQVVRQPRGHAFVPIGPVYETIYR